MKEPQPEARWQLSRHGQPIALLGDREFTDMFWTRYPVLETFELGAYLEDAPNGVLSLPHDERGFDGLAVRCLRCGWHHRLEQLAHVRATELLVRPHLGHPVPVVARRWRWLPDWLRPGSATTSSCPGHTPATF